MTLERIDSRDIGEVMAIIEDARTFQLSYGNKQWATGYPSEELISSDAKNGIGYKVLIDGKISGYLAIVDYDSAYDEIDGAWMTDGKYIALHRIAFSSSFRGKGLFPALINGCKAIAESRDALSIRIDTDRSNMIMQHLLPKLGFRHTGYVLFEGDRKLAYEFVL